MSTRIIARIVIACIGLVFFLSLRLINTNRVTFTPANMSIKAGKGWKEQKIEVALPVCSPRLVSKAGIVHALLLDEDLADPKAAAQKLQANLVAGGKAAPEAFKQEDFTTEAGNPAVHFSYTGKSGKSDGADVRSHHFITRNMRGRCVSINYITSPELESSELLAAIVKTLRVE